MYDDYDDIDKELFTSFKYQQVTSTFNLDFTKNKTINYRVGFPVCYAPRAHITP